MSEEKKDKERFDPKLLEKGLKCDVEQYNRLIACSEKGPEGIKEWNKNSDDVKIWLEGVDLSGSNLEKIRLRKAHMKGVKLTDAHLEGAKFYKSHLEKANLCSAYLENTDFVSSYLEDANFEKTHLQNAKFNSVFVNSATSFIGSDIDEKTYFRNVALENIRIKPGTKILLKYNIRRMNWEDWFKEHCILRWPVRLFWFISNYGISTGRIMLSFLALAVGFSFIYYFYPFCLMVNGVVGDIRGFVHALYFSVVTMTTLGFGDIAANPDSWLGQVVLMVQVILGYVLLGALITRLAVLFTSDGPAGKFTKMDQETKELLKNLKEDKK